ncbi:MAG: hypothetical protein AMS26_12315 [Bacteroides sp. SM23_62]|nr:MAG: hypothetical protein AMS26_12315 [Bacteroides sp. SM23_62]
MSSPSRLIILLFAFAIMACEKNNENEAANNDLLIGSWVNPKQNDSIVTYERSEGLVDNEYGLSFNEDNIFIERKNAGWCGTPPISYADYDGTWTRNDSVIEITVGYWGGTADYTWKILSIDEAILKIIVLEQNYQLEDQQK